MCLIDALPLRVSLLVPPPVLQLFREGEPKETIRELARNLMQVHGVGKASYVAAPAISLAAALDGTVLNIMWCACLFNRDFTPLMLRCFSYTLVGGLNTSLLNDCTLTLGRCCAVCRSVLLLAPTCLMRSSRSSTAQRRIRRPNRAIHSPACCLF